ncbi:hypothetical protein HH214_20175 [Mucilaginibacter robiniae]|uniref:SPW repeat-containing integral membrane domain-containing protein n=1 Tax=Mucilaginibacter robiniae TaxID=2728022 RepID=A0A7L5E6M5_9SPHI|nr:hypothetical protein [Mucilaginibacter robiniae]QJD98027.1 hypothetical protein HH214_20175 [Mucilaginibacter robiniae]
MEKPISRPQHGFTDYSYIPLTAFAPELVGFADEENAAKLSRILSGAILTSSLFTRAEWGLFRTMSFKRHLILDVANGVFALSAPWLFGFAKNKKALAAFTVFGLIGILAGTLSKPEEM